MASFDFESVSKFSEYFEDFQLAVELIIGRRNKPSCNAIVSVIPQGESRVQVLYLSLTPNSSGTAVKVCSLETSLEMLQDTWNDAKRYFEEFDSQITKGEV